MIQRPLPAEAIEAIQGNIAPGFNKDHQAFLLVSLVDQTAGRAWLREIGDEIATSKQVIAFKAAYETVHPTRADQTRSMLTSRWTNVALSWRGLERFLGPAEVATFPATFKTNRVPFAEPQADDDQVDALLILAADEPVHLVADLARHREIFSRARVREVRTYVGHALSGDLRGCDHFGFKDVVSQPRITDLEPPGERKGTVLPPGEFLLGAPGAFGPVTSSVPGWLKYSSYAVFLQLEQHVGVFRESLQREAAKLGVRSELLKASLVGRLQDGSDLSSDPPPTSHVGRARPTVLGEAMVNRHRLLRRGIPYGDWLPEGLPDTGGRGLLFLAYQADLARQFEQVWSGWLNNPNELPGMGVDALVGQIAGNPRLRSVTVARPGPTRGVVRLQLPRFVTPHYGGYFLAPSIAGIKYLRGDNPQFTRT